MVRVAGRVGLTCKKNTDWVMGQLVFVSGQKNRVRIEYFSDWVGLGQKIMTRFAMSM